MILGQRSPDLTALLGAKVAGPKAPALVGHPLALLVQALRDRRLHSPSAADPDPAMANLEQPAADARTDLAVRANPQPGQS